MRSSTVHRARGRLRVLAVAAALGVAVGAGAGAAASPLPNAADADPPWLGIGIDRGSTGVLVTDVIDDTPAALSGLIAGDEILAVAGSRTVTEDDLTSIMSMYRVGDTVALLVLRDGRRFQTTAILAERYGRDELLRKRLVGRTAPAFSAEVVHGTAGGNLADLRGRVVIIDFFSIRCGACLDAHRALARYARDRDGRGLVVLAIADEAAKEIEAYAQRWMFDFTFARDQASRIRTDYIRYTQARPAIVVIDREGRVRFAGIGGTGETYPTTAEALENLEQALFEADRALGAHLQ